jgi:hypothetical protein
MIAPLFATCAKVNNVMSGRLCDLAQYAATLSTTIFGLRNWVCAWNARPYFGLTVTTGTHARGIA